MTGHRDTDGTVDAPESGREALLRALSVRQHVRRALLVGLASAVALPILFVVLLAGGSTSQPLPYYVGLAFVVFITVSMLSVGVLTGRRVLTMAVPPASIVRRSATVGLLAGLLWVAAAGTLVLGVQYRWVATAFAPAALLTPFALWAVHTRFKRTTRVRPFAAVAAWVAVLGALVVADLVAIDMAQLLPELGPGVDASRERLLRAGAGLLVVGGIVQAVAAVAASGATRLAVPLVVTPLGGLVGYLLVGPGRTGLALLALGQGLAWLVVSVRLRSVRDDDVPAADVLPD